MVAVKKDGRVIRKENIPNKRPLESLSQHDDTAEVCHGCQNAQDAHLSSCTRVQESAYIHGGKDEITEQTVILVFRTQKLRQGTVGHKHADHSPEQHKKQQNVPGFQTRRPFDPLKCAGKGAEVKNIHKSGNGPQNKEHPAIKIERFPGGQIGLIDILGIFRRSQVIENKPAARKGG